MIQQSGGGGEMARLGISVTLVVTLQRGRRDTNYVHTTAKENPPKFQCVCAHHPSTVLISVLLQHLVRDRGVRSVQ